MGKDGKADFIISKTTLTNNKVFATRDLSYFQTMNRLSDFLIIVSNQLTSYLFRESFWKKTTIYYCDCFTFYSCANLVQFGQPYDFEYVLGKCFSVILAKRTSLRFIIAAFSACRLACFIYLPLQNT